MYKYFLNITLRGLTKRNVFSIINILGLSIGLAVVLLISLLNFNEQSFDRGFKESKNIYRINAKLSAWMPGETSNSIASPVGKAMQDAVPEVITTVRISGEWFNLSINDNLRDIHVKWVDEDFFRLFDTPFLLGSPEAVMSRPNTIAISESEAQRMFGNNDPIGKLLTHTATWTNQPPMEVVAVFKDYPLNSSFNGFRAIVPLMHHYNLSMRENTNWGNIQFETFCLLIANADTASVNAKMQQVVVGATAGQRGDAEDFFYRLKLQRLTDIHLHSSKNVGLTSMALLSDVEKVRMLSVLSVILLLVACVNYMNLSTARAQKRSREIGISKTVGVKQHELILRLTFETAIFTFVSLIVAFLLAWIALSVFNSLLGEQLSFGLALHPVFLCVALLIWIITTLLAASYPAIYMSGFPPLMAIRSQSTPKSIHAAVRKVLTVAQFSVAIVLIAWVLIVQKQIVFMNNKDLGYNPHNLIGFYVTGGDGDVDALVNDIKAQSSVKMASLGNANFFRSGAGAQDGMLFKSPDDQVGFPLRIISTTPNFIDLMQIKLIAGRQFPEFHQGDTIVRFLLNRAAVDYLEMTPEEAIGKRLPQFGPNEIYGVVENFHFESMHTPIRGFAIANPVNPFFLMLRVTEGNLQEQLKIYEEIFNKHRPNRNFGPFFLDEYLAGLYDSERRTVHIAVVFSILAIFIACLGVFGLTAFMVEQRTKEIGIRKVMGATMWNIVSLFTSSYVKLLCIALVIAIPTAWWVGIQYLQNFAFRISLGWWIFAVAALITIVLTLLTVCVQALKAAMANPVDAIKNN